ncbi:MAG: hypothetical protein QM598_05615 [Protaetiibacter sp.]
MKSSTTPWSSVPVFRALAFVGSLILGMVFGHQAEALTNATKRQVRRKWTVDGTITLRRQVSVTARNEDEAYRKAKGRIDSASAIEAIRDGGWTFEVTGLTERIR